MIWFWAALVVIPLIVEGATTMLVSIWFAAGALAAGLCTLFGGEIWLQTVAFLVVTLLTLIATRPLARKMSRGREATNADRNIGEEAVVVKAMTPHENGEVRVGGLVWAAMPENNESFEVGELVTVRAIRGVKLIVGRNQSEIGMEETK